MDSVTLKLDNQNGLLILLFIINVTLEKNSHLDSIQTKQHELHQSITFK